MSKRLLQPQAPKSPSEHQEQSRFFAILRRVPHEVARWAFAIPNGFLRTSAMRLRAWREGVAAGVSDVFIPFPSNGLHGLFLEFKRPGGTLSMAQKEFLNTVRSRGYKAEVVFSAEEGIRAVQDYLKGPQGPQSPRDLGDPGSLTISPTAGSPGEPKRPRGRRGPKND